MSDEQQGNRFTALDMARVEGVEPCQGWTLFEGDYEDGDGFHTPFYVARDADRDVLLNTSRFDFHPTQARFDYIVGFGFPEGVTYLNGTRGPLCDHSIDGAIAALAERRARAA